MKILFAAIVAFASFSTPTLASCIGLSVQEELKLMDVAFAGKVVKIQYEDADNQKAKVTHGRTIVTFEVSGYWKGDVARETLLHTYLPDGFSALGFRFEEGKEYVVYAHHDRARDWLGLGRGWFRSKPQPAKFKDTPLPQATDRVLAVGCGRTSLLTSADEDLKVLGPPKVPAK